MKAFFSFIVAIFATSSIAAVNDIFPTDVVVPPEGSTIATVYFVNRTLDGIYNNENKVVDGKIKTTAELVRIAHIFKLAGYPFAPIFITGYADSISSEGVMESIVGKKSDGTSDLKLGFSFWPIDQKENHRYLSITFLEAFPTGEYNSQQKLNIGENRYKSTLNISYLDSFSTNLRGELYSEVAFYGNNNQNGNNITQDKSYALTGYLRYITPYGFHPYIGIQNNYGGAVYKDGVLQTGASKNIKEMLGLLYRNKDFQIQLRYGKDSHIENGLKLGHEFVLRLQKEF